MVVLLDTSAWIEFFDGTVKGKRVREIILKDEIATSITTLAEIANWCYKSKQDIRLFERIETIKKAPVIEVNEAILINAGRINHERKQIKEKWGIMDSILLSIAQFYDFEILTKDKDFSDLPNVEIL